MNSKDSCLERVLVIPVLALFIGASILAWKIAESWSSEDTRFLLGGLVTVLGVAVALLAVLASLLVGLAIYRRIQGQGYERPAPPEIRTIGGYPVLPYRESLPPQLTAGDKVGSWRSNGPANYDVWQEEQDDGQKTWR